MPRPADLYSSARTLIDVPRTPTPPSATRSSPRSSSNTVATPTFARTASNPYSHLAPRAQTLLSPRAHLASPSSNLQTAASSFNSMLSASFGSSASTTTIPTPIEPPTPTPLPSLPPISAVDPEWEDLSPTAIDSIDVQTLRSKLHQANSLIKSLNSSLSSLRTTAAHYHLQHKLLLLETSEARARHQVESDITRAEVDVLRLDQSSFHTSQVAALAEESGSYKRRLRKAKRTIREQRDELSEVWSENARLRNRIRENRVHMREASASQSPAVPSGPSSQQQPPQAPAASGPTIPASPATARRRGNITSTPRENRRNSVAIEDDEDVEAPDSEDDRLAALGLLASQVLSQEMDSREPAAHPPPPSTPRRKPAHPSAPAGSAKRGLLSPVAFTSTAPPPVPPHRSAAPKRRRSRDSTISVSEHEDAAPTATTPLRSAPKITSGSANSPRKRIRLTPPSGARGSKGKAVSLGTPVSPLPRDDGR